MHPPSPLAQLLERRLSPARMSPYVQQAGGDLDAAIVLYRWNAAVAAALWESLGHVEVLLRNVLADRLAARHAAHGRPGSWLDDPAGELGERSRADIEQARRRVRQKGRVADDGQTISELTFGFWRFLITRRLTNLWPDLATGFPYAPDRRRGTVEEPVARLHELRNRIAHHQPVWHRPLLDGHADLLTVTGYIDPMLRAWVRDTSRVQATLALRP